jgi:hypothetical protein
MSSMLASPQPTGGGGALAQEALVLPVGEEAHGDGAARGERREAAGHPEDGAPGARGLDGGALDDHHLRGGVALGLVLKLDLDDGEAPLDLGAIGRVGARRRGSAGARCGPPPSGAAARRWCRCCRGAAARRESA